MITDKKREKYRRYRAKLKKECLSNYGGRCYECGEADIDKLELHHPNGDGNKDRAEKIGAGLRSPGGWNFYLRLRRLGYPAGYAVICIKCHDVKHGRTKKEARQRCSPALDTTRIEEVIPF
jgi:hypothetical protein